MTALAQPYGSVYRTFRNAERVVPFLATERKLVQVCLRDHNVRAYSLEWRERLNLVSPTGREIISDGAVNEFAVFRPGSDVLR
jgi:hypothetical protein